MEKKVDWFRDQVGKTDRTRLCIQGSQFVSKKTNFMFLREFAKSHYRSGDITIAEYIQIVSICDRADERMAHESEE